MNRKSAKPDCDGIVQFQNVAFGIDKTKEVTHFMTSVILTTVFLESEEKQWGMSLYFSASGFCYRVG